MKALGNTQRTQRHRRAARRTRPKTPRGLHTATFYHPVAGATMANHETFTLNTLVSTPPPPPPPPLPRMRSCASLKARALRRSLRHRAGGRSETQLCATGR
jgi:hypothetical protein